MIPREMILRINDFSVLREISWLIINNCQLLLSSYIQGNKNKDESYID